MSGLYKCSSMVGSAVSRQILIALLILVRVERALPNMLGISVPTMPTHFGQLLHLSLPNEYSLHQLFVGYAPNHALCDTNANWRALSPMPTLPPPSFSCNVFCGQPLPTTWLIYTFLLSIARPAVPLTPKHPFCWI
jgi:hypothetical protein